MFREINGPRLKVFFRCFENVHNLFFLQMEQHLRAEKNMFVYIYFLPVYAIMRFLGP